MKQAGLIQLPGCSLMTRIFMPRVLMAWALVALALPSSNSRAEQDADWLKPQVEYKGKAIGATIESITSRESDDSRKITLAIPKDAIETTADIEEIVVIGKAPAKDQEPKPINIRYHWASDYDNDHYGLIITLGKTTNFPIRLYLKGDAEKP